METEVFTVEILKTLGDRVRKGAAKIKGKNESYAHAQQSLVVSALIKFLEEMEIED